MTYKEKLYLLNNLLRFGHISSNEIENVKKNAAKTTIDSLLNSVKRWCDNHEDEMTNPKFVELLKKHELGMQPYWEKRESLIASGFVTIRIFLRVEGCNLNEVEFEYKDRYWNIQHNYEKCKSRISLAIYNKCCSLYKETHPYTNLYTYDNPDNDFEISRNAQIRFFKLYSTILSRFAQIVTDLKKFTEKIEDVEDNIDNLQKKHLKEKVELLLELNSDLIP